MFTIRTLTVLGMVLALATCAAAADKKGPTRKNHAKANTQNAATKTPTAKAPGSQQTLTLKTGSTSPTQAPYAENDLITKVKLTKSGSLAPKVASKSAPAPKGGEPKASSNGPTLVPVADRKLFKNAKGAAPRTPSSKTSSGSGIRDWVSDGYEELMAGAPKTGSPSAALTIEFTGGRGLKAAPKTGPSSVIIGQNQETGKIIYAAKGRHQK